jgi:hypothetical protein
VKKRWQVCQTLLNCVEDKRLLLLRAWRR